MGILIANRRKVAVAATVVILLIVYLCSVWVNIKVILVIKQDSQMSKCDVQKIKPNSSESPLMQGRRNLMEERKEKIDRECSGMRKNTALFPELLISEDLNLMFCGFPNLVNEDLKEMFSLLTRPAPVKLTESDQSKFNPKLSDVTDKSLLECTAQSFTTVVIVQHPLEHLASVFEDKTTLQHSLQDESGQLVMEKIPGNSSDPFPTFEQFLQYIMKNKANSGPWIPYTDRCQPCTLRYDIILNSTAYDDLEYLHKLIGIPVNKRMKDACLRNMENLKTSTRKLLDTLQSPDILHQIESFFENDYKLFDFKKYST